MKSKINQVVTKPVKKVSNKKIRVELPLLELTCRLFSLSSVKKNEYE